MADLTQQEVLVLARAAGLQGGLDADDLTEITHTLNAAARALEAFSHPDLAAYEPVPFTALDEVADGGR
ncbi:MAG: hypothetical protein WD535_02210 [Thermaerobacterales bacterium]